MWMNNSPSWPYQEHLAQWKAGEAVCSLHYHRLGDSKGLYSAQADLPWGEGAWQVRHVHQTLSTV